LLTAGCGGLSKHITLVGRLPLRLVKHQRGSASPASMSRDTWIARSMRQSDAEIEAIFARPIQQRGLAESVQRPAEVARAQQRCAPPLSLVEGGSVFGSGCDQSGFVGEHYGLDAVA